ncbi:hypothetical protein [Nocardioides sp. TF02-7]|uniref:hypothetical protein n=1 Tax=Nocardioides sp. TF02-7 TaxID=2917724 RepID=UPI001F066D39|nr:hypothetical protein [Nocardioides sp. TF02-7]UMG92603.1 hypothetical protein MF408_22935 [Nocardioides sp. TF02-7]
MISPDGTKVAWSQLRTSQCAGRLVIDDLTAITDAVPNGAVRLRGLVLGYSPSWVGNNKVVVDDEAVMHLVPVDHPEPKGISWFSAYDLHGTFSYDLNSPAVSRDGSRVAYLMDYDPERIYDHATSGNPVTSNAPGLPSTGDLCVAATNIPRPDEGPVLDELMFSPDGDSMVVGDNGDVTVIGGIRSGSCDERTYTSPLTGVQDVFWSGYTGNVSAPAPDRAAPTVKITKVAVGKRTARVTFRGSDNVTPASGLRFQCQVDKGRKVACRSPQTFRGLKKGAHTVKVWATDKAGNTRSTSARFRVRR